MTRKSLPVYELACAKTEHPLSSRSMMKFETVRIETKLLEFRWGEETRGQDAPACKWVTWHGKELTVWAVGWSSASHPAKRWPVAPLCARVSQQFQKRNVYLFKCNIYEVKQQIMVDKVWWLNTKVMQREKKLPLIKDFSLNNWHGLLSRHWKNKWGIWIRHQTQWINPVTLNCHSCCGSACHSHISRQTALRRSHIIIILLDWQVVSRIRTALKTR